MGPIGKLNELGIWNGSLYYLREKSYHILDLSLGSNILRCINSMEDYFNSPEIPKEAEYGIDLFDHIFCW